MLIVGVDPGLTACHAAVVTPTGQAATVYGAPARLVDTFGGTPAALAAWLSRFRQPDLVVVEVARGAVASARDGDPVLHNNIIAGEVLGHLRALGLSAVPVASGGNATAWAWRPSLGVKVSGPTAKDALTTRIVHMRLTNPADMPVGPRGGHLQDFWDAAGLALAALDRVLAQPAFSPLEAVTRVTDLEAHRLGQRRAGKNASKHARAARAGGAHARR